MKISEIDLTFIKNYMRIEHDLDDIELTMYMNFARSYISNYTNLSVEEIDEISELGIPFLMLVNSYYENKSVTTDANTTLDKVFLSTLNLHKMYL